MPEKTPITTLQASDEILVKRPGSDTNYYITRTDIGTDVAPASSATIPGLVELATSAESVTGTDAARAVTAAGLRAVMQKLKVMGFDGRSGAGACTATGAAVNDIVLYVTGITDGAMNNASSSFESTITVVNQIQQSSASNLSANNYVALLLSVS